jgi:3-methylcrotonyl-CoA carboxylase alpha subunit
MEGGIVTAARLRLREEVREVRLEAGAARLDGRSVAFEREDRDGRLDAIAVAGRTHRVRTAREGNRVFVWCDGRTFAFERARPVRAAAGAEHGTDLLAPMPGRVRKVLVAAGSPVERGSVLLVLEAMKMEHAIRAPRDGVVAKVMVKEGELVEAGVELAELA